MRSWTTALKMTIVMCAAAVSESAATSTDFSVARALTSLASADTGHDQRPDIVAGGGGTWITAWQSQELSIGVGPGGGAVFSRSSDNGTTWTEPQLFRPEDTETGYPRVATNGAGVWIATWATAIGMHASTSLDDGLTWAAPVVVFANVDGGQGPTTSIATDGDGTWVIAWPSTETLGGTTGGADQDILYSRSFDNGLTWSPASMLNGDGGGGFQEYGNPRLKNDGADTWVATWDTLAESWVARSTNDGATWSAPVRVSPAVLALNNRSFPNIDTDGAGRWVVVFELEDVVAQGAIGFSVSSDNGASWGAPSLLHPYFDADHTGHLQPAVVYQGAGAWQVVWSSDNTLGGAIGDDLELLTSYSRDNGLSWSTPAALLSGARSESSDDLEASIGHSIGRTVIAWTVTGDGLGGTLGNDGDILVAHADGDCPFLARNDCLTTTKASGSKLTIKDNLFTGRDSLSWNFRYVQQTTSAQWGDPSTSDGFSLCLYEKVAGAEGLIAEWDVTPSGTCGSKPCWEVDADAASFRDAKQQFGPTKKLLVKAGEDGKASIRISVKGPVSSPPRLPLDTSAPVRVQLVNTGTNACWSGVHDQAKRNDSARFQSVSD